MKKTIEVEFDVIAKAVMRDEEMQISLSVSVPYLNRKVTVTEESFSDEARDKVKKALESAIEEKMGETFDRAQRAAHEAALVSQRLDGGTK